MSFFKDTGKEAADAANRAAFEKWWDSLTTKAKKAWNRYWQRKAEKRQAWKLYQQMFAPVESYCCPKCHGWYATAAERNECKRSHRKAVAA